MEVIEKIPNQIIDYIKNEFKKNLQKKSKLL